MTATEARALMPRHRDPEKVEAILNEQVYPMIETAAASDANGCDVPIDDGWADAVIARLRQDGFTVKAGDGRLSVTWTS
jgi:hypothetical protein